MNELSEAKERLEWVMEHEEDIVPPHTFKDHQHHLMEIDRLVQEHISVHRREFNEYCQQHPDALQMYQKLEEAANPKQQNRTPQNYADNTGDVEDVFTFRKQQPAREPQGYQNQPRQKENPYRTRRSRSAEKDESPRTNASAGSRRSRSFGREAPDYVPLPKATFRSRSNPEKKDTPPKHSPKRSPKHSPKQSPKHATRAAEPNVHMHMPPQQDASHAAKVRAKAQENKKWMERDKTLTWDQFQCQTQNPQTGQPDVCVCCTEYLRYLVPRFLEGTELQPYQAFINRKELLSRAKLQKLYHALALKMHPDKLSKAENKFYYTEARAKFYNELFKSMENCSPNELKGCFRATI